MCKMHLLDSNLHVNIRNVPQKKVKSTEAVKNILKLKSQPILVRPLKELKEDQKL